MNTCGRLAALTLIVPAAALLAMGQAGPDAPLTVAECYNALNEFAAAVVFADLDEPNAEKVYGLLDRLQDQCDDAKVADARASIIEIESILGK